MITQSVLEGLACSQGVVMAKALAEAITIYAPPGDVSKLPLRSSQHWMVAFATPQVASEQLRCFLSSCQTVREEWGYGEAADVVNAFIGKRDFDPTVDVEALAISLRTVTERRMPQTFAASSIAMMVHPSQRVFVFNDLAALAVRVRDLTLSGAPVSSLPEEAPPRRDVSCYATFFQSCERVFADMRMSEAFQGAVSRFIEYLSSVAGPMRSRETTSLDFVERCLFDSVMTTEGWYLRYWKENGIPPGTIAPRDEGLMLSRVVPRRGQDVFASDLAAKYGY